MDPISIISLAASATKAAYTVSTQLYLFVNAAKTVDESTRRLTSELAGLRRSLDATSYALQNPLVRTETATAPANTPVWAAVAGALDDSRLTLQAFEKQITPYQREHSRRGIFKRATTTWKLNLTTGQINSIRDQVHTHTGSLQVALQTLNILISGIGPARAAEDIGHNIADLTEALNRTSLEGSNQQSQHYSEIEGAARAVLSQAPDIVSTGLLTSCSEEAQAAAAASLRAVIHRYDASIYSRNSYDRSDVDNSNSEEPSDEVNSSDSEAELELSLAMALLVKGRTCLRNSRFRDAETYLRHAFGHITRSITLPNDFAPDEARYELALACFYQEKVEEAELILLLLVKDHNKYDEQSLRASHALAMVYLCLFDFSTALKYCSTALKGRRRLFGKHDARFRSSLQLLTLLYFANGDYVSAAAYRTKLRSENSPSSENKFVSDRFSGYISMEATRMSLTEKKEALNELAAADLIASQRKVLTSTAQTQTDTTRIVSHPDLSLLNLDKGLMSAIADNKLVAVQFLLSRGANPSGSLSTFPLHLAAWQGFDDVVRVLLDAGSNANRDDNDRKSPLWRASLRGYEQIVLLLLDAHADVNTIDRDGWTPLICASSNGHGAIIRSLLKNGADMTKKSATGNTPLVYALRDSHLEGAQILIEKGDDVNVYSGNREAPLHMAVASRYESIAELLLLRGAQVNARDSSGCTPLLRLPANSRPEMVELLLRHGARINDVDDCKMTALARAVDWDAAEIFQTLLDHGADVNIGNDRTRPDIMAKQRGSSKCLAILKTIPDVLMDPPTP